MEVSNEEVNIAVVAERMQGLANDMSEVKMGMKALTDAVTKLAVIEVRQSEASKANERAFVEIDKLDGRNVALAVRVAALEQSQPLQKQTSDWVTKAGALVVTVVAGALVALVVVKPELPHITIAPPSVASRP